MAAGVLALALVGTASPARAAGSREAELRLERATAALEREAELLQRFASGPRVGGADWAVAVEAHLTVVEIRVWRRRVAAAEALGSLLGTATASRVEASGAAPALGPAAADAAELSRLRPVLADWDAYRRALSRVLGLLESLRASAAPGVAGLLPPGRVCPVAGPLSFEETWGEERPWGRGHKGEDLHAAYGTPLVAIESGTIVQSGWHWEGGMGVYLEGYYSGDVYYYAHLLWTAPGVHSGAVVEVGDLVGWVGMSGNAESPHLHLGWIPDNAGPWVDLAGLADPYPLIVGICGPG